MALVHLIRHGRAAGGWDDDPDPGLDDVGRAQAELLAERLVTLGERSGGLPILTSPLRRCRETAGPLALHWGIVPTVEPLVAELPSPAGVPVGERVPWLRRAIRRTWPELGERYVAYRDQVVRRVAACTTDTVVVSHFVAINAVIGACLGDERVLVRSLDNASVTVVETTARGLALIHGGDEADTLIR